MRALRRRWPDAHITLLTSSYSAPILADGSPYVDRILPIYSFGDEPRRFSRVRDHLTVLRTWLKLVGRIDLVVNLGVVGGETLALAASLGLPKQIGYTQRRFDRFLTRDLGLADPELGSRERNQIIVEALGVESAGDHLELRIAEADREWAKSWLTAHNHDFDSQLTVLHPGCHWGCNQWLTKRWTETANQVLDGQAGSVVVTGSRREIPMAEEIVSGIDGRALIAAGETTLGQFAALIDEADLVLAVDTAPTQICQALGVPAVVMMGAGNPAWNGPTSEEPMVMLQEWDNDNAPPQVCDWAAGACNGPKCTSRLVDISVSQVLASADDLLDREQRRR
jgi:ADP-heptose:LPS heptosyltransferase